MLHMCRLEVSFLHMTRGRSEQIFQACVHHGPVLPDSVDTFAAAGFQPKLRRVRETVTGLRAGAGGSVRTVAMVPSDSGP